MRSIIAILKRNLTNFVRDKLRLAASIFMSVFMLFIFSFVMKGNSNGISNPTNYLIAGVIIMSVFQTALNNSTSILEDISSGVMKEIIVSPIARWQISIGQVLSSTVISVVQSLITIVIGLFMGLSIDALQFLEMLGVMIAVGATFSSLGLYVATLAKNSATFQVLVSVVMIPFTFLSGAYIPTTTMPKVLLPIVYINPLTYTTAIFRYITLSMGGMSSKALVKAGVAFDLNGFIIMPYMGLIITLAMGLLFFTLCVMKFRKADFSNVKVFNPHQK